MDTKKKKSKWFPLALKGGCAANLLLAVVVFLWVWIKPEGFSRGRYLPYSSEAASSALAYVVEALMILGIPAFVIGAFIAVAAFYRTGRSHRADDPDHPSTQPPTPPQ
jgi:nitrogen fixation-related uncharacterized protein